MMRPSLILSLNRRIPLTSIQNLHNSSSANSTSTSSSSGSSSDDEQKKKIDRKQKSAEAKEKLNLLLKRMIQEDAFTNKHPKLELAKPKNQRHTDVRSEPAIESIKKEPIEKQLVKAVKDVAQSVRGDAKQTESELLQKLLSTSEDSSQPPVANLSDIFKDMKIDRETKAPDQASRAEQVRQLLQLVRVKQKPYRSTSSTRRVSKHNEKPDINIMQERVNLFQDKKLGIFPSLEEVDKWENPEQNKTWKILEERELRHAVIHPPANYFQQMILWTEQGKLWKFPIDNEQDLDEEKKVYFTEHVFLEKHLEPWCPPKGPIRHFMELVCVGLSKNPYITVEQKKEHIQWYRNYFEEKETVLREVGAIPPNFQIANVTNKIEG